MRCGALALHLVVVNLTPTWFTLRGWGAQLTVSGFALLFVSISLKPRPPLVFPLYRLVKAKPYGRASPGLDWRRSCRDAQRRTLELR